MTLPQLHTATVGAGPQRVVFLHGLFGQGKNFTTVAKHLADLATCTLVDLPDHGRSEWTQSVSIPAMGDAVAQVLRDQPSPVCLVGHSLGGKVAMRTALDHPELVERLVVVDISPYRGLGSTFDGLVGAMQSLDLGALASRAEADEQLAAGIPDPVVRGFLMQNLRHEMGADGNRHWRWQMNLDLLGRELHEGVADWPEVHRTFPGPVLWVAGERSDYVRTDSAPLMRELFPRYRKVTVKGAGHWVHSEQPERFVATLRAFLAS